MILDYGGPNVAKPMHVGHLRAAIIGDALRRLFLFVGDRALGDVHLGDWGLPMGQVIAEVARRQPNLPYFDPARSGPYPSESPVTLEDLEEIYPVASAACKADPARLQEARAITAELHHRCGRSTTICKSPARPSRSRQAHSQVPNSMRISLHSRKMSMGGAEIRPSSICIPTRKC